jgi:hypothetical protein
MTDIKEYVTDCMAALIVIVVMYQSIALIQVSDELKTLVGAAAAYLFMKYTPNSV